MGDHSALFLAILGVAHPDPSTHHYCHAAMSFLFLVGLFQLFNYDLYIHSFACGGVTVVEVMTGSLQAIYKNQFNRIPFLTSQVIALF